MLIYSFHGLLILLIGLVGGFFQSKAIKSNNGREVAWRVVHSGGSMAGVMLIALSLIVERLNWEESERILYLFCLLAGTYALVVGMVVAAITGARGIDKESRIDLNGKLVSMLYKLGAILTFLTITYLLFKVSMRIF
ncbi:hypothetical protein [Flexithrix dorotheae]|uniref:hypothetical protein n=1 Tax=Flexithrix dorotheae TaxID=70993 RepID=UPI0003720205|nr:hypothetical protein [Flexithrix dorotheae]